MKSNLRKTRALTDSRGFELRRQEGRKEGRQTRTQPASLESEELLRRVATSTKQSEKARRVKSDRD